jgi:G3E family GTPase
VLEGVDLDFQKIDTFLEEMIEAFGNDMLRYKGVLSIKDEPKRLIIQGVHKIAGFDWGEVWSGNEERKSLMVIIGRDLPKEMIKEKFLECVVL